MCAHLHCAARPPGPRLAVQIARTAADLRAVLPAVDRGHAERGEEVLRRLQVFEGAEITGDDADLLGVARQLVGGVERRRISLVAGCARRLCLALRGEGAHAECSGSMPRANGAGVAEFIVIPGYKLDESVRKTNSGLFVKD